MRIRISHFKCGDVIRLICTIATCMYFSQASPQQHVNSEAISFSVTPPLDNGSNCMPDGSERAASLLQQRSTRSVSAPKFLDDIQQDEDNADYDAREVEFDVESGSIAEHREKLDKARKVPPLIKQVISNLARHAREAVDAIAEEKRTPERNHDNKEIIRVRVAQKPGSGKHESHSNERVRDSRHVETSNPRRSSASSAQQGYSEQEELPRYSGNSHGDLAERFTTKDPHVETSWSTFQTTTASIGSTGSDNFTTTTWPHHPEEEYRNDYREYPNDYRRDSDGNWPRVEEEYRNDYRREEVVGEKIRDSDGNWPRGEEVGVERVVNGEPVHWPPHAEEEYRNDYRREPAVTETVRDPYGNVARVEDVDVEKVTHDVKHWPQHAEQYRNDYRDEPVVEKVQDPYGNVREPVVVQRVQDPYGNVREPVVVEQVRDPYGNVVEKAKDPYGNVREPVVVEKLRDPYGNVLEPAVVEKLRDPYGKVLEPVVVEKVQDPYGNLREPVAVEKVQDPYGNVASVEEYPSDYRREPVVVENAQDTDGNVREPVVVEKVRDPYGNMRKPVIVENVHDPYGNAHEPVIVEKIREPYGNVAHVEGGYREPAVVEKVQHYGNVARVSEQSGSCTPTCNWSCQSRKCDEVCTPVCKAPMCETRCAGMSYDGCAMDCTEPHCVVLCPNSSCPSGECPSCTTQCSEPQCRMRCPSSKLCKTVCEEPVCDWRCSAPSICPKPSCHMVCETPAKCGISEITKKLPPLLPGESAVQTFAAFVPSRERDNKDHISTHVSDPRSQPDKMSVRVLTLSSAKKADSADLLTPKASLLQLPVRHEVH